jgi:hypothetical protein
MTKKKRFFFCASMNYSGKKRRGCAAHPLRFFSFIRLDLLVLGLDELPDASSEGGTNEGTYDENP